MNQNLPARQDINQNSEQKNLSQAQSQQQNQDLNQVTQNVIQQKEVLTKKIESKQSLPSSSISLKPEVSQTSSQPQTLPQSQPQVLPQRNFPTSSQITQPKILKPKIDFAFVKRLLEKARSKIQKRRERKLQRIIEFLKINGRITNDQVQKLVRVSDATATRYMDILEKRGRVKQINKGKYTYYQFIK